MGLAATSRSLPESRTLKALLLECLDHCSSLNPLPTSSVRQRGLARPARYLERNVWDTFEAAVNKFEAATSMVSLDLAGSLPEQADREKAGYAGLGMVRDLPKAVPAESIPLILTSPPPLDPAAWSLSYLWGAWLLGTEAVAPLQPLLRQRGADPAWYARVMAGSLATLSDLLRDDGRLVLVLTDQAPTMVEALVLAASSIHLGVAALVGCGDDYRLELAPAAAPTVARSDAPLEAQICQAALEAAASTIRARGEPVDWRVLHAAIQRQLAVQGLLRQALDVGGDGRSALDLVSGQVQSALEDPSLERLVVPEGGALATVEGASPPAAGPTAASEALYWLARPRGLADPLSDRVEVQAHKILREGWQEGQGEPLAETGFARALYAQFPGPLTPDRGLIAACLGSYGQRTRSGRWQLRPEDLPQARDAEREEIIVQLLALGRRLGYGSQRWDPFDVAWLQGEAVQALFVVRWRAAVSELLTLEPLLAGGAASGRAYLVVPGGRAALVSYKLGHNPLWRRAVEERGWRFIKYRHVRQLATQDEVDEYQLRTIVGLDPIVEREGAQIPLF